MKKNCAWKRGALIGGLLALPLTVQSGTLGAQLAGRLATASANDSISVIVQLRDQADAAAAAAGAANADERSAAVINSLQAAANSAQGALDPWLDNQIAAGNASDVESFWIFNGYALRATPAVIAALVASPDVASVTLDAEVSIPPVSPGDDEATVSAAEWGVDKIRAPLVWTGLGAFSTRGEGSVVGVLDTGLNATHPDLSGNFTGDWFDAVNGLPTPYDDNGVNHGTHVAGTSVGGSAGGTDIGVAPGAQHQACKAFNQGGTGSSSDILQCMQWFMDPDGNPFTADQPGVVNNSWSSSAGFCNPAYQTAVNNWWTVGIFPSFAAGNAGPFPPSASPGNYANAYAVGATDINDFIASFSSRGPSACTGGLFPEASAPGVNIRSAADGVGYRSLSGTSMATPHVTGCVALIQSAADLDGAFGFPSAVWSWYLLNTYAVDLGTPGHDNAYGAGRIDCAVSTLVGIIIDAVAP